MLSALSLADHGVLGNATFSEVDCLVSLGANTVSVCFRTRLTLYDKAYSGREWRPFISWVGVSLHSHSLAPSNREQSSDYTRITILLKEAAGKRVGKTHMDINLNLLVIDCSVCQLIDLNLHDVLRRSS